MTTDPRLSAFCSPLVVDCFQSIVHESEVWKVDPYDVAEIHAAAREDFRAIVHRLRGEQARSGKVFLVKGDSGAGKTHLMRAFRNELHDEGAGYFSYMQMTAAESNYPRYILRHTLDSLEKPYVDSAAGSSTELARLSQSLAEDCGTIPMQQLALLRDGELSQNGVIDHVFALADLVATAPGFENIDIGLVRALLFLQRDDHTYQTPGDELSALRRFISPRPRMARSGAANCR